MDNTVVIRTTGATKILSELTDSIYLWNLSEPLTGIGFYHKKLGNYAHIEIKLSVSETSYDNKLIWNVPQFKIHDIYRPEIEDFFQFVSNYVSITKGIPINLTIEVTDGSFSPTETAPHLHFGMALIAAVKDCFSNSYLILTNEQKSSIETMQQKALAFLTKDSPNAAHTFVSQKIFKKIRGVELLNKVTEKIKNWDLSSLVGVGYYYKHEKYGHVEIKISISDDCKGNNIIWNVSEEMIPEFIRNSINESLTFFCNLILILKNQLEGKIIFEVSNGSNHPVDSNIAGFQNASVYAFGNCFDKDFAPMTDIYKLDSKNRQKDALPRKKWS